MRNETGLIMTRIRYDSRLAGLILSLTDSEMNRKLTLFFVFCFGAEQKTDSDAVLFPYCFYRPPLMTNSHVLPANGPSWLIRKGEVLCSRLQVQRPCAVVCRAAGTLSRQRPDDILMCTCCTGSQRAAALRREEMADWDESFLKNK